jgi:hypothetical protein
VSVFHASWGTLAIWVLSRLECIAGDALHASVVNGSDFFPRSIKIFVTASRIGNRLPETHGVLKCSVELDSIFFLTEEIASVRVNSKVITIPQLYN